MKVVWLSHFVPFPPHGGPFQRSFNLLRCASLSHEVSLIALNRDGLSPKKLSECALELGKYCANVEFWEAPIRRMGLRWWTRLATSLVSQIPFGGRALWSPQLRNRFDEILRSNKGALLHFDSIDLALFLDSARGFRTVLNHHNCESALAQARSEHEQNPLKKLYLWQEAAKLRRLERKLCRRVNVNMVVSENDGQALSRINPLAHCHCVENGTDTSYFVPVQGNPEPRTLIFTGLLQWAPNIAGLDFFRSRVWPLVKRRCLDVRLYVAGRDPSNSINRWAEREPNIAVVANPDDMRPWLGRAAVFVCPVQVGGGTRVKILDAMAMGKPVVSSRAGCEGLNVEHGKNIFVADSPEDFANWILMLFDDESFSKHLGAEARSLVERQYSWEVIRARLEDAYRCASNRTLCCRDLTPSESGEV